jgi:heterotetrameric sarcosine oxidase gamma subunit
MSPFDMSPFDMNPRAASLRAESPLLRLFRERGAVMDRAGPFEVPSHFGAPGEEQAASRSGAVMAERCPQQILDFLGPWDERTLEGLGVRVIESPGARGAGLAVGWAGALDPPTGARLGRLTPDWSRIVAYGSSLEMPAAANAATGIDVQDVSSGLTTLQLVGPRSPDILAGLFRIDLSLMGFPDRRLALTSAVGIAVQVLRWDRSALPAYELTVSRDLAEYFAEAVEHASAPYGLRWAGVRVLRELDAR